MAKTPFTKTYVSSLPVPTDGKRKTYYDQRVRGFCIIVQPSGTKSFYVQRKVRGKTERFLLGRFPETTVEQARVRAVEINSRIDGDENPNDLKRARKGIPTLSEFFDRYMDEHLIPHTRQPENTATNFRYLKKLHTKRLCDISRDDIQRLIAELAKTIGPPTANKAHTCIRAIYNKAVAWEVVPGPNPASGIQRYRVKSRERFLLPEEVSSFFDSLTKESQQFQDFVVLLLCTGARRREMQSMAWANVSLESKIWFLPDSKNNESRTIPLAPQALEILERRKSLAESEWVFPAESKSGHMEEPKQAWRRTVERAGIENFRIHDLRRTLGSWMTVGGANLQVVGKALGHKDMSSTQIYARLDLDPVRKAQEKAVDQLLGGR